MIVLDLCCTQGHRFEAWFASNETYENQCTRGLVSCPECGDDELHRLPSAPAIRAGAQATAPPAGDSGLQALLGKLRNMAAEAEDVGTRFAEEAREIHAGKAPERRIRGRASAGEVRELLEEGIGVLPVPPEPEKLN